MGEERFLKSHQTVTQFHLHGEVKQTYKDERIKENKINKSRKYGLTRELEEQISPSGNTNQANS